MNKTLEKKLIGIAKERQTKIDPSHDFGHAFRVFQLAKKIGNAEKANLDIFIPAALFHDIIVYPKNDPRSKNETDESAKLVAQLLKEMKGYPKKQIEHVVICIQQCSFSKGIVPDLLEAKILQDADRLEATGAISIMRTFSSGGQMNRPFFDPDDPFCQKREASNQFCLDLFYKRLLVVEKRMHTSLARRITKRRTLFLKTFLRELKQELKESNVI